MTVDIAKLEKNLKLKKFNIKKNRLIDPTNTQRSRTKTSNKTQTNKKYKSKEKKIRLSTYLKTERHNVKKTMTPKTSTQVDLRQISLNRKKKKLYAKGKNPTCFEFMDKQKKQSFNSLKLLKNSKQLSQEETFLILKSLESEKILRQIKKGKDIFFLKESKLKKRNLKQGILNKPRKKPQKNKIKICKDIKFGTRNDNVLLKNSKQKIEFNSEKKKY